MKKVLVAVVALAVASSAMAGVLQVGQTAAAVEKGAITATGGFVIGLGDSEAKALGVRGTMGAIENLLVAVDLGYEIEGEVVGLAVAGQYALPLENLPVDLAIRADYTAWDFEFKDLGSLTAGVLVSKEIAAVKGLALYGGVGYMFPLASGADGDVVLTGGATYALPVDNLSMYAELTYVSDAAIGAGVVWAFGGGAK